MSDIINRIRPQKKSEGAKLFDILNWMTTKEAAFYLRISPTALRIAVSRKEIFARKFRGKLYFKKVELDFLIENSIKKEN